MDQFHDFDKFTKSTGRDAKKRNKELDMARKHESQLATEMQRAAMEDYAEQELEKLDSIAHQRERWELQHEEKKRRAAQAAARGEKAPHAFLPKHLPHTLMDEARPRHGV